MTDPIMTNPDDAPMREDVSQVVDWSKPIELMDGTPVALSGQEPDAVERNPDADGDYWIVKEDGTEFDVQLDTCRFRERYSHLCVKPNGCGEGMSNQFVRNRLAAQPKPPRDASVEQVEGKALIPDWLAKVLADNRERYEALPVSIKNTQFSHVAAAAIATPATSKDSSQVRDDDVERVARALVEVYDRRSHPVEIDRKAARAAIACMLTNVQRLRSLLTTAYADGAKEVHAFWKECRPDVTFESEPDFTEAALDYGRHASETDLTAMRKDDARGMVEGLAKSVANILPVGDDRAPGDRVIPIYVRMDELRALRALTAATLARKEG